MPFLGDVGGGTQTTKNWSLRSLQGRHNAPPRIKIIHCSTAFVSKPFRAQLLTNPCFSVNPRSFHFLYLQLHTHLCRAIPLQKLSAVRVLLCSFQLSPHSWPSQSQRGWNSDKSWISCSSLLPWCSRQSSCLLQAGWPNILSDHSWTGREGGPCFSFASNWRKPQPLQTTALNFLGQC